MCSISFYNLPKFFNSVSGLIFSRGLFPQAGQRTNSAFGILLSPFYSVTGLFTILKYVREVNI